MNFLVGSLNSYPSEDYSSTFELIKTSDFSMDLEKELVKFLSEFKEQYGAWPSALTVMSNMGIEFEDLEAALPPADLLYHWKNKLAVRSQLRASEILQSMSQHILEGGDLAVARQELDGIVNRCIQDEGAPVKLTDCSCIDLSCRMRVPSNYDMGISDLDLVIQGFERGQSVTLAGYAGSFKTSTQVSSCVFNAIKGRSSAILTMEMPPDILKMSCVSCFSFTPNYMGEPIKAKSILKDMLTEEEREALPNLEKQFADLPGKISVFGPSDVIPTLYKGIIPTIKYLADQGYNALYLDHIQLLKYFNDGHADPVNRYIFSCTDACNQLASKGYDMRVFFLCQCNRDGWMRAVRKGRYDMSALAEYNELERSSAYVIFLYSSEELKSLHELRVQMCKHRYGDVVEEPFSTFCDPEYSVVGGFISDEQASFDDDVLNTMIGTDFDF